MSGVLKKNKRLQLLLVDDDPNWAELLRMRIQSFAEARFEITIAHSGSEAEVLLASGDFDVCVVDVDLGDLDGFELLSMASRQVPVIPVVMITGSGQGEQLEAEAVASGASDLIYKDEAEERTLHRVLHMALLRREANRRLVEDALIDTLTGLYNRAHLNTCLEVEFRRMRRSERPVSALFIDLDRFKQINDDHDHATGDQVLQYIADCISSQIRDTDLAGRFAGDEFLVLLPGTDLVQASHVAEKILATVAAGEVKGRERIKVSVSMGVASSMQSLERPEALVRAADMAAMAAKQRGRNQVLQWSPALSESS